MESMSVCMGMPSGFLLFLTSPKICDEVKEFKRRNLSTDVQVKTDKNVKACLFLVALKKGR